MITLDLKATCDKCKMYLDHSELTTKDASTYANNRLFLHTQLLPGQAPDSKYSFDLCNKCSLDIVNNCGKR